MANSIILAWKLPRQQHLQIAESALSKDQLETFKGTAVFDDMKIAKVPLLDDVSLEVGSDFKPLSSILPSAASDIQNLLGIVAAASGTALSITSVFDLLLWAKTRPLTFTFEALFYPKTSPMNDVLIPILSLMGLTTLTEVHEGENTYFEVPGISLSNAGDFLAGSSLSAGKAQKVFSGVPSESGLTGKTISIKIPGIISLPVAIATVVTPTFSKDLAEDGTPLWGKVNMNIQSILPVTDMMLKVEAIAKNNKLESQIASFLG